MTLLQRQHEIMLTAPTGSAADNIEGNTYHTALGLSIGNKPNKTPSQRIQRLWSKKTIMVIDEISMLDLQTLARINHRCNIARSSDPNSSELFGGLPIVIFMGDFYQFPPVKGLPLWRQPRAQDKDEERTGRHIWHRFTSVVILDEQMRQAEDRPFRELLTRARHARLTEEDVNFFKF
jgi:PIF1-like helicase